jgi:hypothetical protein
MSWGGGSTVTQAGQAAVRVAPRAALHCLRIAPPASAGLSLGPPPAGGRHIPPTGRRCERVAPVPGVLRGRIFVHMCVHRASAPPAPDQRLRHDPHVSLVTATDARRPMRSPPQRTIPTRTSPPFASFCRPGATRSSTFPLMSVKRRGRVASGSTSPAWAGPRFRYLPGPARLNGKLNCWHMRCMQRHLQWQHGPPDAAGVAQ